MSVLTLLVVALAAGFGAVIGGLMPHLYRRLRRQSNDPVPHAQSFGYPLDPHLQVRIHDLSTAWATRRGHPEAAPLAAGYLADAARDAEARWSQLR